MYQAISSAALAIAVFYAVGLHGSVLLFWLNFLATLACGIVLSYAIAALSPTIVSTTAIVSETPCCFSTVLSDTAVVWVSQREPHAVSCARLLPNDRTL